MSDKAKYILEFEGVGFSDESDVSPQLTGVDLKVSASDLVFILLERNNTALPLCDLAQGLLSSTEGTIKFMGERWEDMSPSSQSDQRGRIGRVFHGRGWISSLTVCDNIILGQMFHASSKENDVVAQANELAHELELDSIPMVRPDTLRSDNLKKYQWVRALLGTPSLLLLQYPESSVKDSDVQRLAKLVERMREKGMAVIWTTLDTKLFEDKNINASLRYRMNDNEMIPIAEDKNAKAV
jgi:phospholipid/cholesterol/gamma-HCH transport system ATP-binding protein